MTNLDKIKLTWYNLLNFNEHLDYDDIIPMMEALIKQLNVMLIRDDEKWESFIDELNCLKSKDWNWFNNKFNEYIQTI